MRYIPWQSLFTSKQSKVMDPVYKPSSIIYSMYRNQGIQRIKDKLSIGASFSQVRKETRETDKHINVYKDRKKRKKGILHSYQSLIREVKGVLKSIL